MRARHFRFALYANGNFGKACLATLVEVYALFFLTDLLGIAPAIAGALLLASLIWDAITDPLWGYLADRIRRRWSTALPHLAIGGPLSITGFLLIFAAPYLPGQGSNLPALAGLFLFRSAYTIMDVPHNSLLAFLAHTSEERTYVASLRIFFSSAGRLAVTAITAFLIQRSVAGGSSISFLASALILSGLCLVSLTLCAYAVRDVSFIRASGTAGRPKPGRLASGILANRNLLIVFVLTAINSIMTPVVAQVLIYYAKYQLGDVSIGAHAVTLLAVAQGISIVFWAWYANRIRGKKQAAVHAYGVFALAAALGASAASSPPPVFATALLMGFAMSGMFMLNWSMLADALQESKDGGELTIFGLYTSTNKVLRGVAHAYVGAVLAFYGFQADPEMLFFDMNGVRTAVFALPLIGSALCLLALRGYSHDSKRAT